jgi:hypothetical protein
MFVDGILPPMLVTGMVCMLVRAAACENEPEIGEFDVCPSADGMVLDGEFVLYMELVMLAAAELLA